MAKITRLQKRRALWKAAMPEVKKLVRRFDRGAIAHCLKVMADKDAVNRNMLIRLPHTNAESH